MLFYYKERKKKVKQKFTLGQERPENDDFQLAKIFRLEYNKTVKTAGKQLPGRRKEKRWKSFM